MVWPQKNPKVLNKFKIKSNEKQVLYGDTGVLFLWYLWFLYLHGWVFDCEI